MNATIKEMKPGTVISTKFGRAAIVTVGTKASRSGKRTFHTYTVRFSEGGRTVTVTRRGLGKMKATVSNEPTPEAEPTPTPTPTPSEGRAITPTIAEWAAARDRLRQAALSGEEEAVQPEAAHAASAAAAATAAPTQPTGLAEMLAEMVKPHINAKVSREEVLAMVDERVAATAVHRTEVVMLDGTVKPIGIQHARFDGLLRLAQARLNTYLVGPAGSGKSTVAENIAKALDLPFQAKSVGLQTSEMSLLGFPDPHNKGQATRTPLRDAYENGGVFLLDEIDSGNAAVLVVLNSLLANDWCSFPDGLVRRHPDFIFFAGANTIGQGGDRQYVGKNQLDATTLDRFVFCDFQYDAGIEASRCGVPIECFGERPAAFVLHDPDHAAAQGMCEAYCRKVAKVRRAIESFGGAVRHVVGPRASIHGTKMIRSGFTLEDTVEMCIWKGLDAATRSKVESRC